MGGWARSAVAAEIRAARVGFSLDPTFFPQKRGAVATEPRVALDGERTCVARTHAWVYARRVSMCERDM